MLRSSQDAEQMRVGYQFYEAPCTADPSLCDSDRFPDSAEEGFQEQSEMVMEKFLAEVRKCESRSYELTTRIYSQFASTHTHTSPLQLATLVADGEAER